MRNALKITFLVMGLSACTGLNKTRTATFCPKDTVTTIPQVADREIMVGQSDSIVLPIRSRAIGVPLIWPNVSNRLTRIKTYEVIAADTSFTSKGILWKYVLRMVGVNPGETIITLSPEGNEKEGTRTFKVLVRSTN